MTNTCTETTFLKEVAEHQLTVLRADGVYRHLIFKNPRSSNMYFEIVTWPNYLAYVGDMGSYVFSRLEDMFQFFRTPENYQSREGGTLAINPCYWSEKLQADDRVDGTKEYSADLFRQHILKRLADHFMEPISPELLKAVEDEILCHADEGEQTALHAAQDFNHGNFRFHDFWESNLQEYTGRYIWCCYALTWGIDQYDKKEIESDKT